MERRMYLLLGKTENVNFCIKFEDLRPMRLEDVSVYQSRSRHFKSRNMVTLQFTYTRVSIYLKQMVAGCIYSEPT